MGKVNKEGARISGRDVTMETESERCYFASLEMKEGH